MESYKEQVLEAIRTLANENEDIVGKWIDEERDFGRRGNKKSII